MSNKFFAAVFFSTLFCFGCAKSQIAVNPSASAQEQKGQQEITKIKNSARVIHVLVALCDNENQGIVPVPAALGNGEDPARNLYWGAAYGIKTYFSRSKEWEKISSAPNPKENVLERLIFKHKTQNAYLIADAYRGSKMKETIEDFFMSASGEKLENIKAGEELLQGMGSASLIAFIGHDGLMDFKYERAITKKDQDERDAIILACASRNYFGEYLRKTNARPLLWTSNLMAPEAYILHDALTGWLNKESGQQIQARGAAAYAKYQRISQKSAMRLLVTGY